MSGIDQEQEYSDAEIMLLNARLAQGKTKASAGLFRRGKYGDNALAKERFELEKIFRELANSLELPASKMKKVRKLGQLEVKAILEGLKAYENDDNKGVIIAQDTQVALSEETSRVLGRYMDRMDRANNKLQVLVNFVAKKEETRDPILGMVPGGDLMRTVQGTQAGGFLTAALKAVSPQRESVKQAFSQLEKALEEYRLAHVANYLADPVGALKEGSKIPKDAEVVKNLENAVKEAYRKILQDQKTNPFKFPSRTEKFLLEMGEKLGINKDLKAIAEEVRKPDAKAVVAAAPSSQSSTEPSGPSRKTTPGQS